MSMEKYTSWAFQIAEELRRSVSTEDAKVLRGDLRKLGEHAWLTWVDEHHQAVFSILVATPQARAKRKVWADPVQRARLCFAAYNRARLAGLMLSEAERLGPGGGYRSTCELAASAGEAVLRESRWFWPFGGEPPFEHWQPPDDLDFVVGGSWAALELPASDPGAFD